ncbi:winged helix-turn-helix transcriptional regulator [Altererythrobacter sp. CC-YST694]|uniref:MarR family winged helix-turn-helix transcriptional regulator n=1 Tax=Altererythrobacter sp. CC-YST694 TaxID=2755038 RepID=UPI001D00D9FE|nr:MarR family winged helix-turn-helix transcriptional regulator [Altererythrobacter sp. CC-YST694]MCB5426318.1 winged helix-turn-helix transcriptional regulator [Altererythrobacter sp. CC-YST694]
MADTRLTALDLRCLMAISLHDGMSQKLGKGSGCYAKSSTLAGYAKTDISNFSKAANRLLEYGYISRKRQEADQRRFTLRLIFTEGDSWQSDQQSEGPHEVPENQIVGEVANSAGGIVGEPTNKIVGEPETQPDVISSETPPYYSHRLDSVETEELDSVETAHRAASAMRLDDYPPQDCENTLFGQDPAEAGLGRKEPRSIAALLPAGFYDMEPDAQLSAFERAFAKIGRDPDIIEPTEREVLESLLMALWDVHHGEPTGYRAARLLGEMDTPRSVIKRPEFDFPDALPLDELRKWAAAAALTLGTGGVGRLAEQAGIPPQVLSRFRGGKALPEQHRVSLQEACERVLPNQNWRAAA